MYSAEVRLVWKRKKESIFDKFDSLMTDIFGESTHKANFSQTTKKIEIETIGGSKNNDISVQIIEGVVKVSGSPTQIILNDREIFKA